MSLAMTRGDTAKLQVAFTLAGRPENTTGASVVFTATDGTHTVTHSTTDGGVVLGAPSSGLATVTFLPGDTASFPDSPVTLSYRVVIVDAFGNKTTTESGTLLVTP